MCIACATEIHVCVADVCCKNGVGVLGMCIACWGSLCVVNVYCVHIVCCVLHVLYLRSVLCTVCVVHCVVCGMLYTLDMGHMCWKWLYVTKQEDILWLNEANHHHGNCALLSRCQAAKGCLCG